MAHSIDRGGVLAEITRRDRKRERTREQIVTAARALFLRQGFEHTTVLQIAETADVAVQTVFNHAPSKEALFFLGRVPYALEMPVLPPAADGEDPADVLVRHLTERTMGYLHSLEDPDNLAMAAQIDTSAVLASYERTILAETEAGLAATIARELPGVDARWAAALLLATTRTHAHAHRRALVPGVPACEALSRVQQELPGHLRAVLAVCTPAGVAVG
ncbi:TetR/AcrR family transcriptional regulator [Klenkia sp. PcliD-1-E]|uniref:TetR/AcrR family transcriptional regulator n=1 Tax=Klenkia sp. PcliD-1-E TaxID=2954492 RepID=UPI0020970965|nr:TetR/AcrR family transcriptional regulator [Klenkia sp. PcliD-1-E]MCO7221011.1 TetR/AcrR family transcriptional regulator [Klenkia sp. PcliD-1-E]